MTTLSIEPSGVLSTKSGKARSADRHARWVLVLHTNSADIRIAMPNSQDGQDTLLVMPRRAENLFSLLSDTVEEELELTFILRGMPVDRSALRRLAVSVGIGSLLAMRPEDLSGGQKARLALALLLLRRPATLVLDNALEAIDESSRGTVAALLRREVDAGMRLVELATTEPLCVRHVDEAMVEQMDGWAYAEAVEIRERVRGWCSIDLENYVRRPPLESVVLHALDLEFQYGAGFTLRVPEVRVRAGEILWVVGPNGTGKTTLMKCLALLLRPRRGSLRFNRGHRSLAIDLAAAGHTIDSVHRFVLYQFQDPDDQIYCESVREELIATARQCHGIDDELVRKYSERLGLSARLRDSPWDLRRSSRRLLTLGSVLCAAPAVALLDEPTVELDMREKIAIAATLADFADSGGACVVVSHDHRFMESVCTARLDMRDGNRRECTV